MATLKNQPPRQDNLTHVALMALANEVKLLARDAGITYMEALETYNALAKINDYDARDEQLAGFAKILENWL
ncbi:hypothetical protein [Lacticaseibacillus saniviri]